ncbi:MAG: pilus assembly protein [Eubacteriales bacterium]|nr:pilus assembly protein [Eubacteriales bacterium]
MKGKSGSTGEGETDGYVVVEAAVLLPLASIVVLLLVWLCSYLYQSCFLSQAAYLAAFRGSRHPDWGAAYVERQLEELMKGEALRFEPESRSVESSALQVSVTLARQTPFSSLGNGVQPLLVTRRSLVRDAAAYIRGIRRIGEIGDG